ncbi:MAG: flavodoxin family protein [Bacilli bacterium]|jgi:multimeric flavodoxin WrbA|nr:flavodoxin family protein [Bacilli bacterium]
MQKQLTILTGSARRNGNAFYLADLLENDAKKMGYEVKRFDVGLMNISGCLHCNQCYKNGKPCIKDDGFNEIALALKESSSIAFVTPLYWYSWPSQLKSVIDRFYSIYGKGELFTDKKTVLLSSCGDEEKNKPFDGLLYSYEMSMDLMDATRVGTALFYNADEPDTVKKALKKGALDKLEKKLLA